MTGQSVGYGGVISNSWLVGICTHAFRDPVQLDKQLVDFALDAEKYALLQESSM